MIPSLLPAVLFLVAPAALGFTICAHHHPHRRVTATGPFRGAFVRSRASLLTPLRAVPELLEPEAGKAKKHEALTEEQYQSLKTSIFQLADDRFPGEFDEVEVSDNAISEWDVVRAAANLIPEAKADTDSSRKRIQKIFSAVAVLFDPELGFYDPDVAMDYVAFPSHPEVSAFVKGGVPARSCVRGLTHPCSSTLT
jgi:hypothetical protein